MYKTVFLVRVYRNYLLNVMESFMFFNIATFTIITWYTLDDIQYSKNKKQLQSIAAYVSVGTVAFCCFLVICFHVYRYSNKTFYLLGRNTKLCKKLKHQVFHSWIQEPRITTSRESDVYQLFEFSCSYEGDNFGYSPPPARLHKEPTTSSLSLSECEELWHNI